MRTRRQLPSHAKQRAIFHRRLYRRNARSSWVGARRLRRWDAISSMAYSARERGLDYEYLLFPDEGHGFAKPESRLAFVAAAERFLAKHLGGRYEPAAE